MEARKVLATLACAAASLAGAAPAVALDDGLARTPPMGFNNWNATHCGADFNEAMVKGMADLFVSSGLKDAGYQYVNLDDCWALPQRDAMGKLVPDPARFPNGIKAVADYVHSKGLKLGIYTSAGTKTCNSAGFPGGLGHEESDAQQFADWGVDYLKYDNCNNQNVPALERYTKMRDALKKTGRAIVYSICEWGQNSPWLWGADVGHLWRTTGDISDSYASMLGIVKKNAVLADYAGPGHWNDPDMLEVGNGGMTGTEYRSHFSLWAVMAAPLLIGSDLRKATPQTMDILENRDVIAVDQDPLGKQGRVLSSDGGHWVFAKPLENGDVAVALFNETGAAAPISTTAAAVGMPAREGYALRDLWTHSMTETAGTIAANVPAHGTVMYRVSADPTWRDYPPATSFSATADTHYAVPGRSFRVNAEISNYGAAAAPGATLKLSGPTSFEGITSEAEAGTLSGAARTASCSACSGGQKVRFIGNGAANWARVGVSTTAAGTYDLTVYAAVSGTRSLFLSVNDGPGVELSFTGTSFDVPLPVTVSVPLHEGANTLRLYNDGAYGPDFDRVVLGGTGAPAGWTIEPADPVTTPELGPGQSLRATWTVTPPAAAAPGTYRLVVNDTPIEVVVPGSRLVSGYLSDQQWLEAQSFWGPVERDMSNGEKNPGDGKPITIGGVQYAKGLGVHAPSEVVFYNAAHCSRLTAMVGVDDEKSGNGSVTFQVWADDREVADSGVVTWQDAAKPIDANIGNSELVRLVVDDGGDTNSDHSDWADAKVECGGRVDVPGGVGGTVPPTLSLTVGSASFGAFTPGAGHTYTASTTANVTSTAGDAALGWSAGHLANGAFSLPDALEVTASKTAWIGPVSNDPVSIAFAQHIGANDALRTGSYTGTVTFTLSTTTP
jgi:alpha-galactosidase